MHRRMSPSDGLPWMRVPGLGLVLFAAAIVWGGLERQSASAETETPPLPDTPAATGRHEADPGLPVAQARLAERFRRLEQVLLRLSELSGPDNVQRAELLKEAFRRSKSRAIADRIQQIAEQLEKNQYASAIDGQDQIAQDLKGLLELLLREQRDGQRENERQRIRNLLKELGRLITQQRSLKARTEGGDDPAQLAPSQGMLAETAAGMEEKLAADAESPAADSAATPPRDTPATDRNPESAGEIDPKPGQSAESPAPSGEKPETPSDSTPGSADGQEAKSVEATPQAAGSEQGNAAAADDDPQAKARERVATARQRMQQAQSDLQRAERDAAVEQQQRAIESLQQARAELDRVLRQLREEERQQMLAGLEARLRRMLLEQIAVYQATCRLDAVPVEQRGRDDQIEAGGLSRQESLIASEADRALAILRDDGASVAFPEAIAQMRDDMQQVVDRLGQADVSSITQRIEEDIIEALKEAVEAVEQMLKDLKSPPVSQRQMAQGQLQERPLVEQLAELKMIRSLQLRVNRRTEWCRERLDLPDAGDDLLGELRRLAQQQKQVERAARELAAGRNQ